MENSHIEHTFKYIDSKPYKNHREIAGIAFVIK
jgi:hypothetical protein